MTQHSKTNHWTATAVAADGNPIDSRWQLQLRTFEPSAPQSAAWHTWAKQAAGGIPNITPSVRYWSESRH